MGSRHSKQPEHSPSVAAAVISNANVASAASKAGKSSKSCLSGGSDVVTVATAEELLEQCKCPISLELMRRPVLPSSGGLSSLCVPVVMLYKLLTSLTLTLLYRASL